MSLYFAAYVRSGRMSCGLYSGDGELVRAFDAGDLSGPVRAPFPALEAPVEHVAFALSDLSDPAIASALAERLTSTYGCSSTVAQRAYAVLLANGRTGPAMAVDAGTNALVVGRDLAGRWKRMGGRAFAYGGDGGGYALACTALRAAGQAVDGLGPETTLVQALPEAVGVASMDALDAWARGATVNELAALAPAVIAVANAADGVARACVDDQARRLAAQIVAVQEQSQLPGFAPVFLLGELLEHSPTYREAVAEALSVYSDLRLTPPKQRDHRAASALRSFDNDENWCFRSAPSPTQVVPSTKLSPTEGLSSRPPIDRLAPREIALQLHQEDTAAVAAVAGAADAIAEAMKLMSGVISSAGRIFYAGAGTSGRLGVVDAAEWPPTFGFPPERMVAMIAGGDTAIRRSVEGAEDDEAQGAADAESHGIGKGDLMIGIAASGATPYTLAALRQAGQAGAATVFITCNPHACGDADITIALDTGPEAVAGSTRLKAGTATKLTLNALSTGAMALAGYVYEGRMVYMRATNAKLRARAVRILVELAAVSKQRARQLLEQTEYSIPAAVVMAKTGLDRCSAIQRLAAHGGRLRDALGKGQEGNEA